MHTQESYLSLDYIDNLIMDIHRYSEPCRFNEFERDYIVIIVNYYLPKRSNATIANINSMLKV